MEAKYLLIVKVANGVAIRNSPRPQSQGGLLMRNVPVGTQLEAYNIINVGGVDYARLVPQNPQRPEWLRVAEADHSVEYVDVFDLTAEATGAENAIAKALNNIADAIRERK